MKAGESVRPVDLEINLTCLALIAMQTPEVWPESSTYFFLFLRVLTRVRLQLFEVHFGGVLALCESSFSRDLTSLFRTEKMIGFDDCLQTDVEGLRYFRCRPRYETAFAAVIFELPFVLAQTS